MEYIILDKEKNTIKKLLDKEYLEKMNFIITDFDSNLKVIEKKKNMKDTYREYMKYGKDIEYIYSGIKKQYLNRKFESEKYKKEYGKFIELSEETEKIYIPMSLEMLNSIANKTYNEFLIGTTGKFLVETKNFDIKDLVILEIDKLDIPYFATTDEFPDILTRILVPPFKLNISKMDIIDIKKDMENQKRLNKKKKKAKEVENEENQEEISKIEKLKENAEKNKENKINSVDIDLKRYFIKARIQKEKSNIYDMNKIHTGKLLEYKDGDVLEKEKTYEEMSDAGVGIYKLNKKYLENIKSIKAKEKELKHYKNKNKNLNTKEYKEKIKTVEKEISELQNKNQKIVIDVNKLKKVFYELVKIRLKEADIDMARQKIDDSEDISQTEMIKYMDLEKSLRMNINKVNQIIEDASNLIKKQQKFAKIGAESNCLYSSIIDGFKIRSEAEKLRAKLEEIYKGFEEYYFNKLQKRAIDSEYESKLGKILEVTSQVEVFLNYLYNPKMTKKNSNLNRFDELILIEENELKRVICKTTENLIAKANLMIIDDELDAIEFKSNAKKIMDLLLGKRKIEKYRELKLEEAADRVTKKLEKNYAINKNYKIHDIIAEIMIFKAENMEDNLIEDYITRLDSLEKGIVKNFVIEERKILENIERLKSLTLPMNIQKMTKEDEVDLEIAMLYHKYGYNVVEDDEEVNYQDTSSNEIKQILDYIKLSL